MQLPVETGIKQVKLNVANMETMIHYYTTIIGLQLLKREGKKAFLSTQGTSDSLLVFEEHLDQEQNKQTTGLYHIAFLLPSRKDLANSLIWLLQHQQKLGAADHGYSEAIYLTDPEGNGIELYCDKPMEEWDIRPNGDIIGVTEELNSDDLLAEADGQWLGMTKETQIGHIHLQVADLKETEKFYESLGFKRTSNFGFKAKFFAVGKYHHHIGVNTWPGSNLPIREKHQLGLDSYSFSVANEQVLSQLKEQLIENEIDYMENEEQLIIKDPNGMELIFIR